MEEDAIFKQRVLAILREYNNTQGFTHRKISDSPTDNFSLVNRQYVTLNGVVANRPISSVAVTGQRYFATDVNIPMTYNGSSSVWLNGVGSVVAKG